MRTRFWLLATVSAVAIVLGLFSGCSSFYAPLSDREIRTKFTGDLAPISRRIEKNNQPLHYVDSGETGRPLVVFIHGAPGAWDAFEEYFKNERLNRRARLISVDRPGYGRSGLGTPERSLAKQAEILSAVFEHNDSALQSPKAILVGHSFGGPVAVQMAVDYPSEVGALVLVAASVDPRLEQTKWYQIPAHWKALSWMVPRDLYTTNEEILPLADELRELGSRWAELRLPIIALQGGKDTFVPKRNADYIERKAKNADLEIRRYRDLSHFIPWSRPDLIVDAILDLLPEETSEGSVSEE